MRISDWSSGVCSSDLVADQSTDQLHDLVLVFAHEQFERALVTRLRADNELFVGNGIAHALMRFSRGRKTLHSQPRNSSKTRFSSGQRRTQRSEEHTSELQSLMRISYAVLCLKKTTENE